MARRGSFSGPSREFGTPLNSIHPSDNRFSGTTAGSAGTSMERPSSTYTAPTRDDPLSATINDLLAILGK